MQGPGQPLGARDTVLGLPWPAPILHGGCSGAGGRGIPGGVTPLAGLLVPLDKHLPLPKSPAPGTGDPSPH